jgi:citrate lyase beta subunit
MRSKLFVPGSRPELFAKAMASQADGVSIDLEDAVLEHRKATAREAVRSWLLAPRPVAQDKLLVVRVNAMQTPHFQADLDAVVQPGLAILNLPKPESVDAVHAAVQALALAEARNGVTVPVRLLLNIETPWALRNAHALAAAHPRVMGLQLGLGDLFEPLGIDRHDRQAIHHVLFSMRMAAGEAGIEAFDGAFPNVSDLAGFEHEARMAHGLGYRGKSCIHPTQIALANLAFQPNAEQIAHARKVVAALDDAQQAGRGAFLVEGRMIDPPFIRRAQAVVADARRYQLI